MYYSVSWQWHVRDKYWVTHPVFLSDVLNDVIGVTSNYRPCSIQLPYAILPRLSFTTCVFLSQKIGDDFMSHPVDENCSLVLVSVHIYFAVLSTFYGCVVRTIVRPKTFVVCRPRPKFNDELAKNSFLAHRKHVVIIFVFIFIVCHHTDARYW